MPEAPEPWLRGPLPGVHPFLAPVLHSFQQVREDLEKHTAGLSTEQVWARPHGVTALGFQLRHMAGSIERLVTYLQGNQLTEAQLAASKTEGNPGASVQELMADLESSMRAAEAIVRALDPARLDEPRYVGRKRLPSTAIGLLTHIAEHTQRHLGEAIAAAKLVRQTG